MIKAGLCFDRIVEVAKENITKARLVAGIDTIKILLNAEEVIMIGNDPKEDYASTLVGIPMILATGVVKGVDVIECMFKGILKEIKKYLDSIL